MRWTSGSQSSNLLALQTTWVHPLSSISRGIHTATERPCRQHWSRPLSSLERWWLHIKRDIGVYIDLNGYSRRVSLRALRVVSRLRCRRERVGRRPSQRWGLLACAWKRITRRSLARLSGWLVYLSWGRLAHCLLYVTLWPVASTHIVIAASCKIRGCVQSIISMAASRLIVRPCLKLIGWIHFGSWLSTTSCSAKNGQNRLSRLSPLGWQEACLRCICRSISRLWVISSTATK